MLRRLAELPGVKHAGGGSIIPLDGHDWQEGYDVERAELTMTGPRKVIDFRTATPGYFEALGFRLLRGRTFRETDRADAPPVAIIDEELARRHWADGKAVGRRIKISGARDPWLEIVGVVASVHHFGFDAASSGQLYVPYAQSSNPYLSLAVETSGDPASMAAPVRALVAGLDPDVPIYEMRTMEDLVRVSLGRRRFAVLLLGFFALLALGLSAVGLYGVISQGVIARVKEIGIRMALGANSGGVLAMILKNALALTAAGVALGAAGALALSRFMASQLYGVTGHDPATFAIVTVVLGAVAVLAACIPALRAVRIDPLTALRYE
jgi:putative ABC transport system permease protein